jgi:ABC-type branched-subunit amino acid transport system substrate-binding protein
MRPVAATMRTCTASMVALLAALLSPAARAETGITDSAVIVGESAVFSGPVADTGNHYRRGIELYFDKVNKAGGVNGRKLQLVALDDAYDPKRTAENTHTLIEQNKVFALIGYTATANLIAAMPIAEAAKVPMFAPLVGTTSFRQKHNHYLFHVRASYQNELSRIVQQLAVIGSDKVAVVYQDSAFGKSNLDTLLPLLQAQKLTVATTLPMAISATSATDIATQITQTNAGAVIMIMAGKMSEVLIRDLKAAGIGSTIYTISVGVVDAKGAAGRLNGALRGVVTASIVPSPKLERYAIVKEYRQAIAASDAKIDNYTVLEGFIVAKVFTEGLRRAGRAPTREGFIAAIEGLGKYDLGEFRVEYGPGNHNGSSFVELEMYTGEGSLIR